MVMDSDYDPGQDSHDDTDISDTDFVGKASDTEYVDKVIKKDGTVRVQVQKHGRGEPDSDSSFDHATHFELDEKALSPLWSLQDVRGKKRACSVSPPPAHANRMGAASPVLGTSASSAPLVRTSTPNRPGVVMAIFGGTSTNDDSLDDTIHGSVDQEKWYIIPK